MLSQGLRNESLKSGGWKGDLADDDSQWSQCVVDGVRDRGRDWHGASLAGAFNALRIERGRRFDVPDADERSLPGGRKEVVEVTGGQSLPVGVVDHVLVEGVAKALGDSAVDLAVDDHRIDDGAAVVHHYVAQDRDQAR